MIRDGQNIMDLDLFSIRDLDKSNFIITDKKMGSFIEFIDEFFGYQLPTIKNANELARELAKKAKLLKDRVEIQLEYDINKEKNGEIPSVIYDFYYGIKSLINDINILDVRMHMLKPLHIVYF